MTISFTDCGFCHQPLIDSRSSNNSHVWLSRVDCSHIFHTHCLNQTLQPNAKCPLCWNRITVSTLIDSATELKDVAERVKESAAPAIAKKRRDARAIRSRVTGFIGEKHHHKWAKNLLVRNTGVLPHSTDLLHDLVDNYRDDDAGWPHGVGCSHLLDLLIRHGVRTGEKKDNISAVTRAVPATDSWKNKASCVSALVRAGNSVTVPDLLLKGPPDVLSSPLDRMVLGAFRDKECMIALRRVHSECELPWQAWSFSTPFAFNPTDHFDHMIAEEWLEPTDCALLALRQYSTHVWNLEPLVKFFMDYQKHMDWSKISKTLAAWRLPEYEPICIFLRDRVGVIV